MGILAKPLAWLLTLLYGFVGNYGITVVILTVIVKFALYPFYKKQILSTAGMADMQPKLQEIQRKYANDKETMNAKMTELYQEEGFNPAGGCLPMIVQMIIIMGLFTLLRNPMAYIEADSNMYFAIHENFLWIKDLSQPDNWILPIMAGAATFFSFWLNMQMNPQSKGAPGSNAMNRMMQYFFPIMIVWLARTYPSGLAIYWFISQFIQIFFNLRFNQLRKALRDKNKQKKKKK
ncbi:MAG: YidC/Oxa1 family membrane protein insertase [Firmicutes bacterium]|nr:YidC/Oxa1 family membrane protein insertase [Bacillota bacterium]